MGLRQMVHPAAVECQSWSMEIFKRSLKCRFGVSRALALGLVGASISPLIPSCTLTLKFECPLLPDNQAVRMLSEATSDITEYIVDIAKTEGLAEGLEGFDGGIAVHMACHARAQNIGPKAAEMLRSLPNTKVSVIDRCSGHGGSWGMMKENYDTALKVGKPAAKQVVQGGRKPRCRNAPLPALYLTNHARCCGRGRGSQLPETVPHPVELIAKALVLRCNKRLLMFKVEITRDDILSRERYSTERKQHANAFRHQRPRAVLQLVPMPLLFENWDTMWFQIQEMLHIEKGQRNRFRTSYFI